MSIEQVHERVWRVEAPFEGGGWTNMFIIRGAVTAVVDSAVSGAVTNVLVPALGTLRLGLSDVKFVLGTHGHMDHVGGNAELRAAGATVALHRADEWRAVDHARQEQETLELYEAIDMGHQGPARAAMVRRLLGEQVPVDRLLDDGDVIDLGDGVELVTIHTPGHSQGAVCYWWADAKALFTGDSIQARAVVPGGLPVIQDPREYARSLRRVERMSLDALYMGHSFMGSDVALGPTARGAAVGAVIEESLFTHNTLARAFSTALEELPEAGGGDVARLAVQIARPELGLVDDEATGFPANFQRTLPAYLAMAREDAAQG
jgi:glyoxylase-like metal-dependent hydrolase (beta-lactamase superfamily II)